MSLKIEVSKKPALPQRFERDGVVRDYFTQKATIEVDVDEKIPFEFSTDQPLPPGPADLDSKSFTLANGRLSLGRIKLVSRSLAAGDKPAAVK